MFVSVMVHLAKEFNYNQSKTFIKTKYGSYVEKRKILKLVQTNSYKTGSVYNGRCLSPEEAKTTFTLNKWSTVNHLKIPAVWVQVQNMEPVTD